MTNMNTTNSTGIDIPGLDLLPHSWQGPMLIAVVIGPYLGRAWHAYTLGGGAKGIWSAIVFGTNTPKPVATEVK